MEPSFWKQPATNLHDLLKPSTSHENGDTDTQRWIPRAAYLWQISYLQEGHWRISFIIHEAELGTGVIYANSSLHEPLPLRANERLLIVTRR